MEPGEQRSFARRYARSLRTNAIPIAVVVVISHFLSLSSDGRGGDWRGGLSDYLYFMGFLFLGGTLPAAFLLRWWQRRQSRALLAEAEMLGKAA